MAVKKVSLDDKYEQHTGRVFLTGSQALARLPMLQKELDSANGLNTAGFISGYRGSPLGGLDKTLWQAEKFLLRHDIHFQPGVNEELAATSVWGSQQVNLFEGAKVDGVFAMWYGKGPGVDRSGDVFRHGNHAGTSKHGGVLLIAGDDHGSKSSTLPHQTEYAFVDAMIPVLNPAGVQEIIDLGLFGWALSRYSGCWVALKTIAETVDASFSTDIDLSRFSIQIPEADAADLSTRWPDKPLEQELRLHNEKMSAVLEFARVNKLNHVVIDSPEPRIGIITTGKSYLDVMQALNDLGIDEELATEVGLRVYKVGMTWPLEPWGVHEFAKGLDEVLVVEEKRGLIEDQLTSQLYNWRSDVRPTVVGKRDESGSWLLPSTGELTPGVIARVIAARLEKFFTSSNIHDRLQFLNEKEQYLNRPKDLVERVPHYCSGCPHNTSTVVPIGSRAMGGIGCHYMATWMDRSTETFTQMGGEGATWIGQAPFTEANHVFQNLGDGTYFHSGILAIRASLAADVNITYKILYNDAVAMTGGQPIDGQLSVAQMAHQLEGEGVQRIAVVSDDIIKYTRREFPEFTTFTHRDDLDAVQCELRELEGTTVIIFDQTCAAEKRRRRKRGELEDPAIRPFINTAVCEGCGDCGIVSNCLSIVPDETEFGRKRKIEQSSCNKDMSCIKGFCPSFVTVIGGELKQPEVRESASILAKSISEPMLPEMDQPYGIVLAGVGGTGVTTLGAILGMAAHIENKGASVLDMTGLAQKFGAVVTHVQIAANPQDIRAARIATGGAKLVIGCDLVVAASNDSMVKVDRKFASAVINSHEAMTAEFTRDADALFPASSMHDLIIESVGKEKTSFIDATRTVEELLGGTMAANIFLAGFAYQKGLIPISGEAIAEAIRLNGTSVENNQRAFYLGRLAAENQLPNSRISSLALKEARTLDDLIMHRKDYLVQYQNQQYAERYESLVRRVQSIETAHDSEQVTSAVARYYFKLLAYKDEYEVARLYSTDEFRESLKAQFQGNYKLEFNLAPPLIAPIDKHSGLPRKMRFGSWMLPAFKLLAKFRFLRGSRFDPFSYTQDRKLERKLINEYEKLVDNLIAKLESNNLAAISDILSLPEKIRGYGYVKANNAKIAAAEEQRLLSILNNETNPVKWVDPKAA
ncbi:MAG: indolepyruvate ferredoxin oxidoreductase family protein [Gammaproteobacteria bacterium]|nr:indolepyruvate ferredoxin oxidoreductase family protein [Gammaproteobacteria bacterium]